MSAALLVVSLIAGMLSVLAPCIVGMLPVLVARGIDGKRARSPWWIIIGLASSIFIFSILLKSTTLLLGVPDAVWRIVSGGIVTIFGIVMVWPNVWEIFASRLGFGLKSQHLLASAGKRRGRLGDILLGASLGPVFSACSPTYLLIVATILPAEPLQGVVYLALYVTGLALMMVLAILVGRRLTSRLGWGINPNSLFHKIAGLVLIVIGLAILTGVDKSILGWLVGNGWFDWQVALEDLLQR